MFYLYHVIAIETTSDDIVDDYNHTIRKGTKYLKCKYLQKRPEKKGSIFLQIVTKSCLRSTSSSCLSFCFS